MKIERQDGEFETIGTIPVGTLFLWEGHPSIKIRQHKTDNVVLLDKSEAIYLPSSVEVQIVNAKVVLYYD